MFYIKINNKPILKYLQKEMIWNRNLFEYTLKNYSDINKYDIQFFGSSHTYRTFDTKIFEKKGINCYNWGSSSQTPMNSYSLIKKYGKNSKKILVEVYPINFILSGKECVWDLIASPIDNNILIEQCINLGDFRTWQLYSIKYYINKMLNKSKTPDTIGFYKGYISVNDTVKKNQVYETYKIDEKMLYKQITYLKKIITFCKENKIEIILVSAPIPSKLKIINEYLWKYEITNLTKQYNVKFLDYLRSHKLKDNVHFFDDDHLNQAGVELFCNLIVNDLYYN